MKVDPMTGLLKCKAAKICEKTARHFYNKKYCKLCWIGLKEESRQECEELIAETDEPRLTTVQSLESSHEQIEGKQSWVSQVGVRNQTESNLWTQNILRDKLNPKIVNTYSLEEVQTGSELGK